MRRDRPKLVAQEPLLLSAHSVAMPTCYAPLVPADPRDQGDPYALALPDEVGAPHRYYVYTTGDDRGDGCAFPVYASPDLSHWTALEECLIAGDPNTRWAPCVRHVPALPRPFVMLYSRAVGRGEQAHVGHQIRRADSTSPAGPFADSGHVLTTDLDFAIDPDVYQAPDGSLRMAFATDFVDGPPVGTGLAEAEILPDLTALVGPVRTLGRAGSPWQLYEASRVMPWKQIPGVDWSKGQTACWHCMEAPAATVSPSGRRVILYSGGNFSHFYAVGALVEDESGRLVDVSREEARCVVAPRPQAGFYGPGHCSLVTDRDEQPYLMLHARFGAPDAPRQMCLAPLRWTEEGIPYCPVAP